MYPLTNIQPSWSKLPALPPLHSSNLLPSCLVSIVSSHHSNWSHLLLGQGLIHFSKHCPVKYTGCSAVQWSVCGNQCFHSLHHLLLPFPSNIGQCQVYSAVYSVQATLYSVNCTGYSVQCTVYTLHCTVHTFSYCTVEVSTVRYTVQCLASTMYQVAMVLLPGMCKVCGKYYGCEGTNPSCVRWTDLCLPGSQVEETAGVPGRRQAGGTLAHGTWIHSTVL